MLKKHANTICIVVGLAIVTLGIILSAGQNQASDAVTPPQLQAGCTTLAQLDTEELFVKELFACDDIYRVYTFDTAEAKDNWLTVAQEFGVVALETGDLWLKVER